MPKQFLSAISITTGLLTTLGVNGLVFGIANTASLSSFSKAVGANAPAPWHFVGLPQRYAKPPTVFDIVDVDGKKVLRVRTDKSWGSLVHPFTGPAEMMSFGWRLDKPLTQAGFKSKATEDAALKVCVSFDMPANKIPVSERTLFKFAQFFSSEKLPVATLCYVWAQSEDVGTVHASPTTGRVRYMVLNSGTAQLKTWQEHQRNLGADFLKVFGNESNTVPAVTAIIVGADSDNTESSSLGYVTDISVQP